MPKSVRIPQPAPRPNTTRNTRFTAWFVTVLLLQAWSTAMAQTANRKIAMTARPFITMRNSASSRMQRSWRKGGNGAVTRITFEPEQAIRLTSSRRVAGSPGSESPAGADTSGKLGRSRRLGTSRKWSHGRTRCVAQRRSQSKGRHVLVPFGVCQYPHPQNSG